MSLYTGARIDGRCHVLKEGHPLSPRWSQSVRNHSPDGFNWGYCGSGCAQLALAILLEETTVEEARALYQDFKRVVVAVWKNDRWAITSEGIQNWLSARRLQQKREARQEEEVPDEME
jgi:hypothetical protein